MDVELLSGFAVALAYIGGVIGISSIALAITVLIVNIIGDYEAKKIRKEMYREKVDQIMGRSSKDD